MPKIAEGTPETIQCLLEKVFLSIGFKVMYDGELANEFPKAGKPSFFTRTLRLHIDSKPADTWIRFTYNLRTGDANLNISRHDFIEMNRRLDEQLATQSKYDGNSGGTVHVRQKDREDDSSPAGKSSSPDVEASRASSVGKELT